MPDAPVKVPVLPPPGVVPRQMVAAVVRRERYGPPRSAYALEVVDVPQVRPGQVLVKVEAAGVNYNGVWAALGRPLDVIATRGRLGDPCPFHVGGSDGAGVVWALGAGVTQFAIGDHVILSSGLSEDESGAGATPPAWGYESNWGSFAQFTVVPAAQCHSKPQQLTWEQAGCFLATAATAWRQLCGWPPHTVQRGDPVLVWGGAGGLGSMAIQIVRHRGGIPIAVVSSDERARHCLALGARGVIDRRDFDHWGSPPRAEDAAGVARWRAGVRAFQRRFREVLGEPRDPRIVLEHPGEDTLATSLHVCDAAGMVVTCGATTGHTTALDLRYLWTRQKRLQGSHYASARECRAVLDLAARGELDPCLSEVFPFEEIGQAHQLMLDNLHRPGQMAVRIHPHREER